MAKAVTSEKIVLTNVRLAFPNLDKPTTVGKDPTETPKYRASFLLDPSNKDHAALIAKIGSEAKRIAAQFWDNTIPKSLEKCFGQGNDLDKVYNGYEDMVYVKANSATRIPIVGRTKGADGKFAPLAPGDAQWPYGGCYVNASITLWTQESHGRKAINGNLLAIQFVKDGEAFAGGKAADPDEEFQALEDSGEPGKDPFDL